MKVCPRCGFAAEDEARFCPRDGSVLQPIPQESMVGRVLMGQFEILERIGKGTAGTVYKAKQLRMDRLVAVKVLRPELATDPLVLERFHREAKTIARLSHPNIITVHVAAETPEGLPYLVMEYVDGPDLDTVLTEKAPLALSEALRLAIQIGEALAEAHAQGIAHRDLKPANIKLAQVRRGPDVPKVLDFGIAKILHESQQGKLTKTGTVFGTPYYVSPEQASGSKVDHRTDIYSLGVILYRMVTGRLPFESGSGLEVLIKHIRETPPRPSSYRRDLPESLERCILRAMAKSPEERYQSAEEMLEELRRILEETEKSESIRSPRTGQTLDMTGWQKRRPSSEQAGLGALAVQVDATGSGEPHEPAARAEHSSPTQWAGSGPSGPAGTSWQPATDTVLSRDTTARPVSREDIKPPPAPYRRPLGPPESTPSLEAARDSFEAPRVSSPSPVSGTRAPEHAPSAPGSRDRLAPPPQTPGTPPAWTDEDSLWATPQRRGVRLVLGIAALVVLCTAAAASTYYVLRRKKSAQAGGHSENQAQPLVTRARNDARADADAGAPSRPRATPAAPIAKGLTLKPGARTGTVSAGDVRVALELLGRPKPGRSVRARVTVAPPCGGRQSLQAVDPKGTLKTLNAASRKPGTMETRLSFGPPGLHRVVYRCVDGTKALTIWFGIPVGKTHHRHRSPSTTRRIGAIYDSVEDSGEAATPRPGTPAGPAPTAPPTDGLMSPEKPAAPPASRPRPRPTEGLPAPPDEPPPPPDDEDLPPPPDG